MKETEIQNRADELQKEMHDMVDLLFKSTEKDPKYKNLSYQDVTNIYFLRKIAEIEYKMLEYFNKSK